MVIHRHPVLLAIGPRKSAQSQRAANTLTISVNARQRTETTPAPACRCNNTRHDQQRVGDASGNSLYICPSGDFCHLDATMPSSRLHHQPGLDGQAQPMSPATPGPDISNPLRSRRRYARQGYLIRRDVGVSQGIAPLVAPIVRACIYGRRFLSISLMIRSPEFIESFGMHAAPAQHR